MTPGRAAFVAALLALAGCGSSRELIGAPRAPILPDQVQLFLERPARDFDQIAILSTSSRGSFSFSAQGKADVVIRRLKDAAAKLGANGILLQEITDEADGSMGTGIGTEHQNGRGTIDLGVSASALMLQRHGRAIAIYLPPPAPEQPRGSPGPAH